MSRMVSHVQTGLALYLWQRLIIVGSSRIRVMLILSIHCVLKHPVQVPQCMRKMYNLRREFKAVASISQNTLFLILSRQNFLASVNIIINQNSYFLPCKPDHPQLTDPKSPPMCIFNLFILAAGCPFWRVLQKTVSNLLGRIVH